MKLIVSSSNHPHGDFHNFLGCTMCNRGSALLKSTCSLNSWGTLSAPIRSAASLGRVAIIAGLGLIWAWFSWVEPHMTLFVYFEPLDLCGSCEFNEFGQLNLLENDLDPLNSEYI